jgi:hypothetical protein
MPAVAPAAPYAPLPAASIELGGSRKPPVYRRWWFWTGAGALVAGAIVGGVFLTRDGPGPSTLPPIHGGN